MKKVLILGHTGFIGNNIFRARKTYLPKFNVYGFSTRDINLADAESIKKLKKFCDRKTTVIFCSGKQKRFGDTPELFSYNVKMVANFCGLLEEFPIKRLLFVSSAGVYGEEKENRYIDENTPVAPSSYYALSKLVSEQLFQITALKNNISLLIVRPPFVYGPGDNNSYSPSAFLATALLRKPISLWGDGSESREFVFIDDLVNSILRLLKSKTQGTVNLCRGEANSFMDAISLTAALMEQKIVTCSQPRTKKKVNITFRPGRLKEELESMKFISLREGLKKTLAQINR